jgi:predicted PurR-regulated permease PerM
MDFGGSASLTRTLSLLAKVGTATLVVVILSKGRPVLMPIAFAAALAFILTAPMKWLQHRISRIPALALVMLLAAGAAASSGYVLAIQVNDLTTELGQYTESMRRKVAGLQGGSSGPLARVEAMIARVTEGLEKKVSPDDAPVRVTPARISRSAHLWDLVKPLAEPLITVLFVLVLCLFMLGQREDLRNRLIRLVGTGNVTLTTRTLDEGAQRITRYLLTQTMINTIFGVVVGLGLYLLGIPYAVLWGALAAMARFVPYLGAAASMLLPAALAFAIFPGWSQAVFTMALFIGMDVLTAYLIEPLLIGHRTGVSSIALLVSALFWAWLWGPVGLALAAPITVSLAVLGRHVPGLQFLVVLLGDDQVIGTEISFYQRLLARDEDEASEIAQAQQAALGPTGVVDRIIIPTLVLAARDLARREITTEDETFVVTWSRDIFEHLLPAAGQVVAAPPCRALGIAARQTESELLLEMLAVELAPQHGKLEVVPPTTALSEVMARVEHLSPEVVCVAALPPEGGPYARQLCHRLKERFPDLRVVAFRPDEPGVEPTRAARRLREAGADVVVATLAEASAEVSRHLLGGKVATGAGGAAQPLQQGA